MTNKANGQESEREKQNGTVCFYRGFLSACWWGEPLHSFRPEHLAHFGHPLCTQPERALYKDYTIQGLAIDSDRLKNGGSVFTKEYFDHLLEQIREIRMPERRFYQKITDLHATALTVFSL